MSLEQIGGIIAILGVIYTLWKDWPEIKRRLPRRASPQPPPRYGVYSYSYLRKDPPGIIIARHLILNMGLFGLLGFFAELNDPNMNRYMAAAFGVAIGIMGLIYVGIMGFIFGGLVGLFLRQTTETIAASIKGAFITGLVGSMGCGAFARLATMPPPPPGQTLETAIMMVALVGAMLGATAGIFLGAIAKLI